MVLIPNQHLYGYGYNVSFQRAHILFSTHSFSEFRPFLFGKFPKEERAVSLFDSMNWLFDSIHDAPVLYAFSLSRWRA